MSYANLDLTFKLLMGFEGGYVNDPKDPGGPTKYGVTLKTLEAWRRKPCTAEDVKNLGMDEAKQIFKHQYWDAVRGSDLPAGVDLAVVDMAYNSGSGTAAKTLQRCLGLRVDGVIGSMTEQAAHDADAQKLVISFCDARLAFLKQTKGWAHYAKGWTNRVVAVRKKALELAVARSTPVGAEPLPMMDGTKADHAVAFSKTPTGQAKIALGVAAVGTQASDFADQIQAYSETFTVLKYVFAGLMAISFVATVYLTIQRFREENPA